MKSGAHAGLGSEASPQRYTPPMSVPDQPAGASRIIALMNQKGGVGKTTTAVNLAAGIALQGRRVLLIDLDPQAHATLHVGMEVGPEQLSALDVLLEPDLPLAEAIKEVRPNLSLLPAVTDLAGAEVELARIQPPERFRRLGRSLDRHAAGENPFEFVLIDCPPSLGVLTLSGLAAAREVIVPMQAHFLALQGLGKLMETVSEVVKLVNPRLLVTGVVICQHDSTTTHSREVVADLESFFEQSRQTGKPWRLARVLRPLVRRNVKMAESPSFGKTIFEYAPWCPGAIDYRNVAEKLVTEWDEYRTRTQTAPSTSADVPVPTVRVATSPAASTPA